jgi:hypothetical protein
LHEVAAQPQFGLPPQLARFLLQRGRQCQGAARTGAVLEGLKGPFIPPLRDEFGVRSDPQYDHLRQGLGQEDQARRAWVWDKSKDGYLGQRDIECYKQFEKALQGEAEKEKSWRKRLVK